MCSAAGSVDGKDQSTVPQARAIPPPPPKFSEASDDRVANSMQVDEAVPSSDEPALPQLPVSNEVILRGHHKIISAMDVERSGARVVTGGMDYQVCLYDFNGMKADGRPFRELIPQEGHPVHAVTYSPSGDAFLVVTGEPRAKVCAGAMSLPTYIYMQSCTRDSFVQHSSGLGRSSRFVCFFSCAWHDVFCFITSLSHR